MRVAAILALSLCCAACGSSDPGSPDGGDAGVEGGLRAPAAPGVVDQGPCPDGWKPSSAEPGGATVCDPWGGGAWPTCEPGEAALPGRGCVPVGGPCPEGTWPDGEEGALHVLEGATGGDGSREAPFGSIGDAIRAAGSDGLVLVGEGSYTMPSRLTADVHLRGVCAERVTLRGVLAGRVVVNVEGGTTVIERVTVRADGAGMWVDAGATLEARGVRIDSDGTGVRVDPGATFSLEDSTVRGATRTGVHVSAFADVTLDGVAIEGVSPTGLLMTKGEDEPGEPGRVRIVDTAISEVTGSPAAAVFVDAVGAPTATVAIERLATRTSHNGLLLDNVRGTVEHVVVHGAARAFGIALTDSETSLRGVRIHDAGTGMSVMGGMAEAEAVVVRGGGARAQAVSVEGGGSLRIRGLDVAEVERGALTVTEAGSVLEAEDVTIRDVASIDHEDITGLGIAALQGGELTVRRAHLADTTGMAIALEGEARLEDITIDGVRTDADEHGRYAFGVFARGEIPVTIERLRARRTGVGPSWPRTGVP